MYAWKRFRLIHKFNRQLLWSIRYLHVHGLIIFCLFLAHKGKANTEGHKIYFRLICLLLPYLLLKVKSLELIYWLKRCFLIFVFNFCRKNPWNFEFEEMEMNNLGFCTTKIWPNAKEHHVCQSRDLDFSPKHKGGFFSESAMKFF